MTGNQTSCFHTVEDVKCLHQKDCFVTMIDPVKKADLNNRGVNDTTGSTGSSSSGVNDTTGSTSSGVNDTTGSTSSGVNGSSSSGVNGSTGSSNSTGVTRSNISTHSIYQNSSSSKPSSSSTRKNHRKNGRVLNTHII